MKNLVTIITMVFIGMVCAFPFGLWMVDYQINEFGSLNESGTFFAYIVFALMFGFLIWVFSTFYNRSIKEKAEQSQSTTIEQKTASSSESSGSSFNISEELQKAKDMLEQGLIDEDEYKSLKAKIIEQS